MIKIELDGHKVNVPSTWSDITLGDYEKWYMLKPQSKAEQVQYMAEVCKVDAKLLLESSTEVFESLAENLKFIFEAEFEPKNHLDLEGEKYFIAPSDKLTLGEWVDLDAVLNDEEQEHKLSEVLAIVCRQAGESYNIEKTEKRATMFRQITCDKILPLISFFLLKDKKYKETLHHCSVVVEQANLFLRDTKTFVQSGDGIKQLPIWQRIRYRRLMKSLEKQLSKFSDLCSIE